MKLLLRLTLLLALSAHTLPAPVMQESFGILRAKQYSQIGEVSDPTSALGNSYLDINSTWVDVYVQTNNTFTAFNVQDPNSNWVNLSDYNGFWHAEFPAIGPHTSAGNWIFDAEGDYTTDGVLSASAMVNPPLINSPYLLTSAADWGTGQDAGKLKVNVTHASYTFNWGNNWSPGPQDFISFSLFAPGRTQIISEVDFSSGTFTDYHTLSAGELSQMVIGQTYYLNLEFNASAYYGTEAGGLLDGFHRYQTDSSLLFVEVIAVPEPSTWALMLLGTGTAAFLFWRRRQRQPVA